MCVYVCDLQHHEDWIGVSVRPAKEGGERQLSVEAEALLAISGQIQGGGAQGPPRSEKRRFAGIRVNEGGEEAWTALKAASSGRAAGEAEGYRCLVGFR